MTNPVQIHQANSYLIDDVDLWTQEGQKPHQQLWIENGVLRAAGTSVSIPPGAAVERISGRGRTLMPAGVDAQVHLRVPGQGQKELPETGLRAALRGGYAALLTMPNTQPTVDSVRVLQQGQDAVRPFEVEYGVRVFWSAAITKHLNSNDIAPYQELVQAGVRAFTNDGLGVESDQVMDQAFAGLESLDVPLLQHAEIPGHGGTMAPGPIQRRVGAAPYSDEPEWKMVERDLRELKKHPRARYHVLHVSSAKTLALIERAKADGLNVTAEVSPHHLFFNCETLDADNTSFKMNPPIRGPEDQMALWKALASGVVDFVATDHAPHEIVMKQGHFDKVAFGTIGLETTLPVLLFGCQKGWLTRARLVEVFAVQPARFLRLPVGLGEIKVGAPFHAVWVDVEAAPHTYTVDDFSSLSKNSCFLGASLPGRILGAFHEKKQFKFN